MTRAVEEASKILYRGPPTSTKLLRVGLWVDLYSISIRHCNTLRKSFGTAEGEDSNLQFRDASPPPRAWPLSFGGAWRRRQPPQEPDRFAEGLSRPAGWFH